MQGRGLHPFQLLLGVCLVAQLCFWWGTHTTLPRMETVPPLPTERSLDALSFGDKQYYFRYLALELQSMGDTYGRCTPLKNYDYRLLQGWFFALDLLDSRSHFVPSIVSYYYSATQHRPDVRYLVEYLVAHSASDPGRNWWWLTQAVLLANYRLKDKRYALELSHHLTNLPGDVPLWVREMPAFIHEELGEKEQAYLIAHALLQRYKDIPEAERNFLNHYLSERLKEVNADSLLMQNAEKD